jgi:hypothetical protein
MDLSYNDNTTSEGTMRTFGKRSLASVASVAVSFAQFGAAFGLIVATVLTAIVPFSSRTVTVTVPVSFAIDTPDQVLGGRANYGFEFREPREQKAHVGIKTVDRLAGSLKVPTTNKYFIAANGAVFIAILLFAWFVLGKLRAVLHTLVEKQPFAPENAARIRWIGLSVIAGELAYSAIVFAENVYARAHVTVPGVTFDFLPRVDFGILVCGLIIVLISEVFRAGTRLDEEQSLTI